MLLGVKHGISDIPHAKEGSRDKCCHRADPSPQQKMLYRETSGTHPDCSERSPYADPHGEALGLTLQAIS